MRFRFHSSSVYGQLLGHGYLSSLKSGRISATSAFPSSLIIRTVHNSSSPSENNGLGGKSLENKIEKPEVIKSSILTKIKEGAAHYWHGSKLLAYETKISGKLLWKLLNGHDLIRREKRQLRRSASDLLRLVPFVVIMIIPFLEFALPVLLKLFPNMLPSTFEDKATFENKRKRQLKVKIETAKFLQEALETMAETSKTSEDTHKAIEFAEAFRKARITGESLSSQEILNLSKSLSDTITLENMPRAQLASICRYMNIKAFGTDNFLRYQIRTRMSYIKKDDQLIDKEGIKDLTYDELVHACHSRGIKSIGAISRSRLESNLQQWLDLHLRTEIPSIILILSRVLAMQDPEMGADEALQSAIMSLPESAVEEATLEAGGSTNSDSYKKRLHILEQQEGLIAEELAQEKSEKMIRKEKVTSEELENVSEAINILSSSDPVSHEKAELQELKEDIAEFREEIADTNQDTLGKTKAALALESEVEKLIGGIEEELAKYELEVGNKLQMLKVDENGQLTIEQLESVFKLLKDQSIDQDKIKAILRKFDNDGDGKVFLKDVQDLARQLEDVEGTGTLFTEDSPSASMK